VNHGFGSSSILQRLLYRGLGNIDHDGRVLDESGSGSRLQRGLLLSGSDAQPKQGRQAKLLDEAQT